LRRQLLPIDGLVVFPTTWGWCGVAATATGVSRVILPQPTRQPVWRLLAGESGRNAELAEVAAQQLRQYFQRRRRHFTVPVDISALPAFSRRLLAACATIPWGDTRSYGQLAAQVGLPGAARAVGQALGRNPVPILIPCHRVIRADGSLGGFGAGLEMKRRLLELEGTSIACS